jgi:hypothetical protein
MLRCRGGSDGDVAAADDTRPADGARYPAQMLSSVVLPEPDGPRSVRNCPCGISRSIGCSACTDPNHLLMPANWTVLNFDSEEAARARRTQRQQQHHRRADGNDGV